MIRLRPHLAGRGALVLALGLALGACAQLSDSLGLTKQPPDEFNVVTRAPLAMPPNLDVLLPPEPGKQRPQELQTEAQAQVILLGQQLPDVEASPGEQVLMADARVTDAEQDIRATIDFEHGQFVDEKSWYQEVLFWLDHPDETEVVIDPVAERQRLQNNAALGLPANEGDFEALIIEPEEKALFEGIF